ncbi:esterase-like activity of phytase family protein [Dactylosporangium sp. AC04546]|uniref:esterase-like activity of phytase family protein n=1 Tax=Dactylosporangium sp. AC04546 TaxID=2862460 RepID=UPI001EDCBA86|nr:esterase-like activity of phytase family protein [Dactylosporangium sp. AC04546]WVK85370.1 esterase-like activity of phytase family protein [Dactylosporangium sp. AC04546]
MTGVSAAPAAAAPSPSGQPSPTVAGAGQPVCIPDIKQVWEISGLVATANGFMAVQDSQPNGKSKIYQLDNNCKLLNAIGFPTQVRDPEDMAVDKNGTFWIADIGDNDEASGGTKEPRKTIAVWSLPSGSREPTINRLAYPDGKKRDAEALLLAADGSPIIITKTPVGEVWVPEGPLQPKTDAGVKLKKVGQFNPQDTKTANPLGLLGWKLITGAATSPDGSKVVIRTYSDAYEFDVKGGDVVKAITTGKPRITPLPNEPQGEAITYSADGKTYITASDIDSSKKAQPLLRYTPTNISPDKGNGANLPTPSSDNPGFLESLTLQDITYAVAAIGIVGLILVVAGVFGIRRARAARRLAGPAGGARGAGPLGGPDDDGPGGPDGDGPRGGGTVYGAQPAPAARGGGGNVYGGAPSSPAPQGTTYGGGPGGGNTYGSGGSGGSGGGTTYGSGGSGGGTYGSPQGGTYGSPAGGYDAQPQGPRGFGQAGGFPPPPPGGGTRGVYGGRGQQPDDYDGYERGYAPHR